jgi:hypothetical protein
VFQMRKEEMLIAGVTATEIAIPLVRFVTWMWQRPESVRRLRVAPLSRRRRASAGARTARRVEEQRPDPSKKCLKSC